MKLPPDAEHRGKFSKNISKPNILDAKEIKNENNGVLKPSKKYVFPEK